MGVPTNAIYADGGPPLTGDGLNTFVQTVDTFPTLRSFIGVDGMQVSVGGQASVGDGKGGSFYFNSSSTATDDNLTVIVPNGGVGAWLRLPITVGVSGLSSADGATATFLDIGAQAASGTNVSSQNIDLHYLDTGGTRQTTRVNATSSGLVWSATGAGPALDFTLSGVGHFSTGDTGGFRVNGRTVISGDGVTASFSPDTGWTQTNIGNASTTINVFGTQMNLAPGLNVAMEGYLNLVAITAPAAPAQGWVLYNDVADSHVRLKKSDGTIVDLTP